MLKEYGKAHRRKDLAAVMALIDFEQEAYEALGYQGVLGDEDVIDAVRTKAESLRDEYRSIGGDVGFGRPMDHKRSKIVSCVSPQIGWRCLLSEMERSSFDNGFFAETVLGASYEGNVLAPNDGIGPAGSGRRLLTDHR